MVEYQYLDNIDSAIMCIFDKSESGRLTTQQVRKELSESYNIDLDYKKVWRKLKSLSNHNYLDSVMEKPIVGKSYCVFIRMVTA